MIDDVYEPLARYRDEFRQKFAALARDRFAELTRQSGVDVEANRAIVGEVRKLESNAASASAKKSCCGWLSALGFIGAAVAAAVLFLAGDSVGGDRQPWFIGLAAGLLLGIAMIPLYVSASKRLSDLKAGIAAKKDAAWKQMEPLNDLYTWDLTTSLIEATVPRLSFDPYFTAKRLESLRGQFGWDDSFNDGKSVIFAQSGVINGNPFVFAQYLDMEWGAKTYEGTKEISWTEWEEDSDGKSHMVTKHETLHARVTKPIPVYHEQKLLIYGNDAAPNLSFSREPSGFSGSDIGFFDKMKMKWRLNRLKAYSRNLNDDSDFTLMSNHEFETWFHAKDRDNEVEFRLLFTPVAQPQMLKLMKDDSVGYGDDFAFVKQGKVNMLASRHLSESGIDTDPAQFRSWDYDGAKSFFLAFNENYFKVAYFALAPLLAIPLYQQTRTHEEIWKGVIDGEESSFWEHETLANYLGEGTFAHPDCVTRSILKTSLRKRENGESEVEVTAHGYRGEDRVDYEEVYGSDGNYHDVPVEWTEYLPVHRSSGLRLREGGGACDEFRRRALSSQGGAYRRSILSFLAERAK